MKTIVIRLLRISDVGNDDAWLWSNNDIRLIFSKMKKTKAERKTNARSNSRVKNKTRLSSPVPNHAPTNPNDSDTIKFSQSDMKIKQDRDHQKYKDKIYNLT